VQLLLKSSACPAAELCDLLLERADGSARARLIIDVDRKNMMREREDKRTQRGKSICYTDLSECHQIPERHLSIPIPTRLDRENSIQCWARCASNLRVRCWRLQRETRNGQTIGSGSVSNRDRKNRLRIVMIRKVFRQQGGGRRRTCWRRELFAAFLRYSGFWE